MPWGMVCDGQAGVLHTLGTSRTATSELLSEAGVPA